MSHFRQSFYDIVENQKPIWNACGAFCESKQIKISIKFRVHSNGGKENQ